MSGSKRFVVSGAATAAVLLAQTAQAQTPQARSPTATTTAAAGSAAVPAPKPVAERVAAPVQPPAAVKYRSFAFTHLVYRIPAGDPFVTVKFGWFCRTLTTKTYQGGQVEVTRSNQIMEMMRQSAQNAGYSLDGYSDNVFEHASATSETELAAIVTHSAQDYCEKGAVGALSIAGSNAMTIEWQVYDKLQKTVLAKVHTDYFFDQKEYLPGNQGLLFNGALLGNIDQLMKSDEFRRALAMPEGGSVLTSPGKQTPMTLAGAAAATARPVGDAVGAVVLISAGEAEGSGFLVSTDGMVMTDHHVVGDAKYVKVRWADGVEGLGEVVRSDKVRDVALVKTDPRGRRPLALRREPLQPGDEVFAIGSPMGEKFQSTVTRGIVSAYRTFEGLNYIQSDVNVTHGSSGGPLLDEKGRVVGLTESGYVIPGAPAALNLFTPVTDALEFLSASAG